MNLEWNRVTWYSKALALAVFIVLPIVAFWFGVGYGELAGMLKTTAGEATAVSVPLAQTSTADSPTVETAVVRGPASSSTWDTYTNSKYHFSFKYPSFLTESEALQEYPDGGPECTSSQAFDGTSMNNVTVVSLGDLLAIVACEKLTPVYIKQFENASYGMGQGQLTTTTVAGRDAYQDYFSTATDYTWNVVQVPLSNNRYLELEYTYKPSPYLEQLSDQDWAAILASVRFF